MTEFIALLDNYKLETRQEEEKTITEFIEELDFLDAILKTDVMKIATEFLIDEGKINDASELKPLLQSIWFAFYSRSEKDQ